MKLSLLAAVASVALMSSGVLAQTQENGRHEERPGAAGASQARPVQERGSEPSQAPRAAQTNERGEQGSGQSGARAAQTEQQRNEPSRTKAESGNRAQELNSGEAKGRNERAQNGSEKSQTRSAEPPETQAPTRAGAAEQRQDERTKSGAAEQRQDERTRTGATEQRNPAQTGASGARDRTNTAQERKEESRGASAEGRGQPRVVGNVRTSSEHATRATEILMRSGRRESVNINVRVGARIPETVTILPVPEEVISFAPEYRGYNYFIENDEIVFVSPQSHEVVGMIEYEGRAAANDETRIRAARPCPTE